MQRAALDYSERNVVALTDADMENIARIRAWRRGMSTDAAVVEFALELAANDADHDGVGFKDIEVERYDRYMLALTKKREERLSCE